VDGCFERCEDLLLRQGKDVVVAAPRWVIAGKLAVVVVTEVLGY